MGRWHRPDLEEGWANRTRASEMLGISVRTLLRWHQQEKGPARRRKRTGLRYQVSEIEDWLSRNPRHQPTNP